MKHRIVHTVQKFLLNPPIKLALAMGVPLPGYALLETKGRKTGKPRRTPVGDGRIGNQRRGLDSQNGNKRGDCVRRRRMRVYTQPCWVRHGDNNSCLDRGYGIGQVPSRN